MPARQAGQRAALALIASLLLALVAGSGCSRLRYRLAADREVRGLVAQKAQDPRWAFPNFPVNMDPRSRYFDPCSIDNPPMPEDDPSSHRFMHCVDGMTGYRAWHAFGDRTSLENPRWRELLQDYAEVSEDGAVKLDLKTCVQLAILHSPDYRAQIEDIYLSALDVSTERFRFDTQFFGNSNTVFTHTGDLHGPIATGPPSVPLHLGENNNLEQDLGASARRHFATGADLVVNFANSFVWQFAGTDTNATASLLSFNLVQPLLRAGGRAVALEQLTIVERVLLGNIRTFERYRQGFFTNVAVGDASVQGPQRRGGFLGGTGLTGFSGQGSGGLGEVGQATGVARLGFGATAAGATGGGTQGFAGGGAGMVGGYVGLLQQLQQVRNTQDSLNAQLRTLGLLEANLEAGLIDIAQVDQFRQNIETERANLLAAQVALRSSIDSLLVTPMGLPPDLPVELDDEMIRQFRFLDPKTNAVKNSIEDFVDLLGRLPATPDKEELATALDTLAELRKRVAKQFVVTRQDLAQMRPRIEQRIKDMDAERVKTLKKDEKNLQESFIELETHFKASGDTLQSLVTALPSQPAGQLTDDLVALSTSLSGLTDELSLVQARARLEAVTLETVKLESNRALDIARANRLDWMNNRAALVDTWRLIEFNANALKANLDITFSGDLGTVGTGNSMAFNGRNGALRVGVRFDAPFTRLLERNNYRQVLINYQQDRRRLIQLQDQVNQNMRRTLRQMNQLAQNLEIQRRAVVIAVRRVDQTRENLNRPPEPVEPGEQVAPLGPTAAQNLLTALSDLRNSQNNFMSVWLNYYATRMILVRELGIMKLDENGMWIETPLDEAIALREQDCPLPPALPVEWMIDAGVGASDPVMAPAAAEENDMHPRDEDPAPRKSPWARLPLAKRSR